MIATGTALALTAAATVGGSLIQANAAKKAAQAQTDALSNIKGVDIPAVTQQAYDADLKKYQEQFNLLNKVDPLTGAIRDISGAGLLENALGSANSGRATGAFNALYNENINIDPADLAFYNQLRSEAARQLSLGGDLSPEQQAEFVRAGLEGSAARGFRPGSSAEKQTVGKLLASEQEALANSRRAMAQQLFGFATDLKSNRNNTLAGITSAGTNLDSTEFGKLIALANLADSRVPDVGLSGGDIANLAVGNSNTENSKAAQIGAVNANRATANGQIVSGLLGGLASLPGQALTYSSLEKQNKLFDTLNKKAGG